MRCRSPGFTWLASTTPRGLPKLPSASVNTRSTLTSMAMCPMLLRQRGGAVGCRSGRAALVGAHRVEHGHSGADRPGDRGFSDAVAEQAAQHVLVVHRGLGRIDELLDDLDEAVRVVVKREVTRTLEDLE